MQSRVFEIEAATEQQGSLAIMPRPIAGEWLADEMQSLAAQKVNILVSLLEYEEEHTLGLSNENKLCTSQNIAFIAFPIPDRNVPASVKDTLKLVVHLREQRQQKLNIVIHCRAGIGRSSLIAACVLAQKNRVPEDIFTLISQARGLSVPDTLQQSQWFTHHYQTFCC